MVEAAVDKSTWLVELPGGSREWRERVNGGCTIVKTEPAPALLNHTHSSFNLAHEGNKMEITKLTIVDGIITELEFGV
ncbi:hypothetical protein LCGC14_1772440 [marine sediment metagenome]|uniref:Uncharacterized protein n=1 Tax=marine sediment metagenome TaxID=412755 RepID=A0A0F9GXU9_9ZZZZ